MIISTFFFEEIEMTGHPNDIFQVPRAFSVQPFLLLLLLLLHHFQPMSVVLPNGKSVAGSSRNAGRIDGMSLPGPASWRQEWVPWRNEPWQQKKQALANLSSFQFFFLDETARKIQRKKTRCERSVPCSTHGGDPSFIEPAQPR